MSVTARPFPSSPPAPAAASPAGPPLLAQTLAADEVASDSAGIHSLASALLDSQQLLQGRRELQILHQGQIYRLQQTRQGKLILTK